MSFTKSTKSPRRWRHRRISAAIAIVCSIALIAAACGDDDDDDTTPEAPAATTAAPASPAATEAPSTTAAPAALAAPESPAATTAAPATMAPTTTEAPVEQMMDPTSVGLVFDLGGRGDLSFNDAAAAGLDRAIEDFELDAQEASPNDDGSNREAILQLQADRAELVLGIGFLFADSLAKVAADNPDTSFAIIDGFIAEATPNIVMLLFAEHEGSFLVGAAAALKSQTGTIGYIGGVNIPTLNRFEAGYIAGARAVNPDIEILSQYLSEPPDFSGFGDPASAQVLAQSFYEQGADVIYHAAGGSGNGLFAAAKEFSETEGSKVWAIGVDSDQYLTSDESVRPYILTSMLKRVDVAVYQSINAVVDGSFEGGIRTFSLVDDGVGYSTSGGFVDDIADQLEDYKQQIIDGDIVVPATL